MEKALLELVEKHNAETQAWMDKDPENRWGGMYCINNLKERGIFTVEALERDELSTYIYEEHKTAFGVKGRHFNFDSMSLEELKETADYISNACDEQMKLEAQMELEAIRNFEEKIEKFEFMAGCRQDAIRWILQSENLDNEYDTGYICYTLGLPYSYKEQFEPFIKQ